jgi:hypothetical protein
VQESHAPWSRCEANRLRCAVMQAPRPRLAGSRLRTGPLSGQSAWSSGVDAHRFSPPKAERTGFRTCSSCTNFSIYCFLVNSIDSNFLPKFSAIIQLTCSQLKTLGSHRVFFGLFSRFLTVLDPNLHESCQSTSPQPPVTTPGHL